MVGRLLLSFVLFLPFAMTGFASVLPSLNWVFIIYCSVAFIRMLTSAMKVNYFDFLFDIIFISAVVYLSLPFSSFLTILYLFPIFFSSLLLSTKKIFIFPAFALTLYGGIFFSQHTLDARDALLNIALHCLSFFLIALAGHGVKQRIARQEAYIRRLEEERIRMQGYERLFRVSADLAHELRNPLAAISASVQFMREGTVDAEMIHMLESETERLSRLVDDFLQYARPSEAPAERIPVVDALSVLCRHFGTSKDIVLKADVPTYILANRTFFDVALGNILKNAVEAAAAHVRVSTAVKSGDSFLTEMPGKVVEIIIEDDGSGVPAADLDRVFEPFVTTKKHGTGLGLAIAYRIITGYGGIINVDRSPVLGGARFSVTLPAEE